MDNTPGKVKLAKESELALAISRAVRTGRSLLVDTGDAVYSLFVEGVQEAEKTPSAEQVKRSREGILKASGGWKDVDTEAFKVYIAERRRTSSRPAVSL